jgi:hypothetical protein
LNSLSAPYRVLFRVRPVTCLYPHFGLSPWQYEVQASDDRWSDITTQGVRTVEDSMQMSMLRVVSRRILWKVSPSPSTRPACIQTGPGCIQTGPGCKSYFSNISGLTRMRWRYLYRLSRVPYARQYGKQFELFEVIRTTFWMPGSRSSIARYEFLYIARISCLQIQYRIISLPQSIHTRFPFLIYIQLHHACYTLRHPGCCLGSHCYCCSYGLCKQVYLTSGQRDKY